MDIVSTKGPLELRVGDVITRRPYPPGEPGRWAVTARPVLTDSSSDHVWVDFRDEFGRCGVFIVPVVVLVATADNAVSA